MSLLPIIYTSVLIFTGVVTTVLLVSYIIYRAKGGGPKPAAVEAINTAHYPQQRRKPQSTNLYSVPNHSSRNLRTTSNQANLMFYKKPVSASHTQNVRRQSSAPRLQVLNKPSEKKIVVVKKSASSSYDANNFLGYYNENERGVLIQA